MRRREFLSALTLAGAGAAVGPLGAVAAYGGPASESGAERLRRRPYGKELSVIGLGGIVVTGVEQSEANDTVAWAVEHGVNYFDVAPSYGNAQQRLGPALKPFREGAFLACKTAQRDAAAAQAELDESLKILQTDHFDLYQLHGLTSVEEVDRVFAPGGAMEVFTAARSAGKVRHIGFSAHSVAAAFRAMDLFNFDSVLFPFNAVCIENGGFGPDVLQRAYEKNVACLALKALAWTPWPAEGERKYPKCWYQPNDDPAMARLLLSYTLDLPVVAAVPPGDWRLFKLAVEIAQQYKPLEEGERRELLAHMRGVEPIFRKPV